MPPRHAATIPLKHIPLKSAPKKNARILPTPASPPRLALPPLLQKTWEFVRSAEEAEGRTLAPLTGSTLEAQLLIHRLEVRCWVFC